MDNTTKHAKLSQAPSYFYVFSCLYPLITVMQGRKIWVSILTTMINKKTQGQRKKNLGLNLGPTGDRSKTSTYGTRSGSYPIILVPTIQEQMSIAGLDDAQAKPQQGHEQNDSTTSAPSKCEQGKGKTSGGEAVVPHDQQKVSGKGRKGAVRGLSCGGGEIAKYRASYTAHHTIC